MTTATVASITTSSTLAPTTTVAPATTSTTTYADVEAAVRAAHTRFMAELFARDERITGPEAILPLAEELTVDPILQRIKENVAKRVESGERRVGPGYDSNIVEVTILDDTNAQVLDCSQDRGEGYSSEGELLSEADDFYMLRQSALVLIDGRWMVSDVFIGGNVRCDPSE